MRQHLAKIGKKYLCFLRMHILISFFSKYRIQKGSIAIIVHVLVKKDFTCEKFVLKRTS